MSRHLVISCDGQRPAGSGEACRGWLPLRSDSLWDTDAERAARGWTRTAGRDLCPSCTRAAVPA